MDINSYFKKIIVQSETIRNFLEIENVSVPPRAMYAYVCNGDFVWEEKREFFKELLNATEDTELKEQIQEKLEENERSFELFKNPQNCVYLLKAKDKEDMLANRAPSAFGNFESAWKIGHRMSSDDFIIYKKSIVNAAVDDSKNVNDDIAIEGEAYFRKDGKLKYVYVNDEKDFCQNKNSERIEDLWHTYPQPFGVGDIVRKLGDDDCICVIRYIQEYNERIHRNRLAHDMGYDFNGIELTVLNCKTGVVSEDYLLVHPYDLEYYPEDIEEEKELAYKVIETWSEVLKGEEVQLPILLESYSRFRKELENKEEKEKWEDCLFSL